MFVTLYEHLELCLVYVIRQFSLWTAMLLINCYLSTITAYCVCSEQVLFPLHYVGKLCDVDFEATVSEGGPVGQAGAIRLALSRALLALVDTETAENMRLGESCFILHKDLLKSFNV